MRMDQLLSGLPGILAVCNDMTVYGKDEHAHDAALYNPMKRPEEYRLIFNSTKCFIKQPKIMCHGQMCKFAYLYTATSPFFIF